MNLTLLLCLLSLVCIGFLAPFWPLCALGVMLIAALGRPYLAFGIALFLDLLWGAPGGVFRALPFFFMALVLVALAGRYLAGRYFFPKSSSAVYW